MLNPDSALNPRGVFESPPVRFDFFRPPSVHTLIPDVGPVAIGSRVSVEAHGLDTLGGLVGSVALDTRCRFGDTVVPATYVAAEAGDAPTPYPRFTCFAPRLLQPDAPLETLDSLPRIEPVRIAFNGQQFGTLPTANFTFFAPPLVQRVEPAGGPEAGGTHVWIRGANLHYGRPSKYRCRFGDPLGFTWATIVPATFDARCAAARVCYPSLASRSDCRSFPRLPPAARLRRLLAFTVPFTVPSAPCLPASPARPQFRHDVPSQHGGHPLHLTACWPEQRLDRGAAGAEHHHRGEAYAIRPRAASPQSHSRASPRA